MHSDGGSRADVSAAAWIVEAMREKPQTDEVEILVLATAGTFFETWNSSFDMEAIAPMFSTNLACEYYRQSAGM